MSELINGLARVAFPEEYGALSDDAWPELHGCVVRMLEEFANPQCRRSGSVDLSDFDRSLEVLEGILAHNPPMENDRAELRLLAQKLRKYFEPPPFPTSYKHHVGEVIPDPKK